MISYLLSFFFSLNVIASLLFISNISPVYAQSSAEWAYPDRSYRIGLSIPPSSIERREFTAADNIFFNELFKQFNDPGTLDINSLRLTEASSSEQIIDMNVPFQFNPDPLDNEVGEFIMLVKGTTPIYTDTTPPYANRQYYLYFDTIGHNYTPAQIQPLLNTNDNVNYQGQPSIRIQTPNTIYYYHKQGGGFASMIDKEGNDWISYNTASESAGSFRGIPNLVNAEATFHPGGTGVNTQITASGSLLVRIQSTTPDNQWGTVWDVYPHYAFLRVYKYAKPYWLLYEGTPGGTFSATLDYMVDSQNVKTPASQPWTKVIPSQWIYFGDEALNRVLFAMRYHYSPYSNSLTDSYKPLDKMMSFGFGRANDTPLIDEPTGFVIGFVETKNATEAAKIIDSYYNSIFYRFDQGRPEKKPAACTKTKGDADCNGIIDLVDFEIWRKEFTNSSTTKSADFDANEIVNLSDFEIWRKSYYTK